MKSIGVFTQLAVIIIISFGSIACTATENSAKEISVKQSTLTIGFGSCANQNYKQPIWKSISAHKPDIFILLGDTIYPDSPEQSVIAKAYETQSAIPEFASLRKTTQFIGTWDDHDYGGSNVGVDFAGKHDSKKEFIKFFNYPELNALKELNRGIYHTRWITHNEKHIQIIMLDTRWYRSPLVYTYLTERQRITLNLGPLEPTRDKTTTILGKEQWLWLESELKKPADLRILVSSIQVIAEFTGWEAWANFPHERTRLLNLLDQYVDNKNIIIISGEIHRAEISRQTYTNKSYLDVTSSGLAVTTYPSALNIHREGDTYEKLNYGMIYIQDDKLQSKDDSTGKTGQLKVTASIYDLNGNKQLSASLRSH